MIKKNDLSTLKFLFVPSLNIICTQFKRVKFFKYYKDLNLDIKLHLGNEQFLKGKFDSFPSTGSSVFTN